MQIFNTLKMAISEILDTTEHLVHESTYLIRELNAESIDLLELALIINRQFHINVNENIIFLKSLRSQLQKITLMTEREQTLQKYYPHLSHERILEILSDIDNGPVLKISDLVDYIQFEMTKRGELQGESQQCR